MIGFTKQERMVVSAVLVVVLFGLSLSYVFKKYPELVDVVNLIDSKSLYPKININTASIEELVAIPYIGDYTAKNIVEHREREGPFLTIESLKEVKGIRDKNFEKFRHYLKEDLS